jgi:hypothetical protein
MARNHCILHMPNVMNEWMNEWCAFGWNIEGVFNVQ